MAIPPLALSVIMCDVAYRDRDTGKWYVLGSFSKIGFVAFPGTRPLILVFLSLIEVNGVYDFRARIVDVNEANDPIHESGGRLESREPLVALEFTLSLVNVQFPEAGEYRLQILVGEEIIAERKLFVHRILGGSHNG